VDTTPAGNNFHGNWNDPASGQPIDAESGIIRYRADFSATGSPRIETPVLEDVTITYLPKTQILYRR